MTIDTKRLASDPGYWDELKAPEDATHACIYLGGKWQWMKANLSGPFNYYWHQRFSEWQRQESEVGERIIPRPQKPAVERGGEFPPVGCECEYRSKGGSLNNGPHTDWRYCRVLAMTHFYAIISLSGPGVASNHECSVTLSRSEFRPIRTKAQRDRDELVSLIVDYTISEIHPNRLADAIISRYNLEPKDV